MRFSGILIAAAMSAHPVLAEDSHHKHTHASPYAGQQARDIKALSRDDIEELLRGGGWGLAKAAELNGMPGPTHLLDMAAELGLSSEQTAKVTRVRDEMRANAVTLGERFVDKEAELEARFRRGDIAREELGRRVEEIERTRAELRVAHLAAHLEVSRILTKEQVARYGRLRGYR
jgi:Spy/CpxP family protein refolding chaperone